jgi:hypothetical protein
VEGAAVVVVLGPGCARVLGDAVAVCCELVEGPLDVGCPGGSGSGP